MGTERNIDRLARYIIYGTTAFIICAVCWYLKNIILFILLAAVVSLVGNPVMKLLKKIKIKGKSIPSWILATFTLILIVSAFFIVITRIIPIVGNVAKEISLTNITTTAGLSDHPITALDKYLIKEFPGLGPDFQIETVIANQIKKIVNLSNVSAVIGSVASVLKNLGIGLFSVLFISFFFIRDDRLFPNIVAAIVPEKQEKRTIEAIDDISYLLSRYFIGLLIEIAGVGILNFTGLKFVAGLSLSGSVAIAFTTSLLNIIPYVGPLAGGAIGTVLGLALKFGSPAAVPGNGILISALVLIAIFCFTQLVDNFIYQPVIYSNSIKAHPLEIFIVLLIAGNVGGIIGMFAAIPAYTAIRVIAIRFFGQVKAIRRLIPNTEDSRHYNKNNI